MLGIDTSKATLAATLLNPVDRKPLWQQTVPNTPAGILQLLAQTPPHTPWVIEPTGRYSQEAVRQAYQHGQTVLQAPTRPAKAFAQSWRPRAKTDRIDSQTLAMFALSRPLAAYPLKSAMAEQIDQLLSVRKKLSRTLSGLRLQQSELPYAADTLAPVIAQIRTQLQAIDKKLAKLGGEDEPLKKTITALRQVQGVGLITATALATRLTSREFPGSDQFVAYVGLDVGVRQSGKREGRTGLTKRGDAELRRLLYNCAQANLRCKDSPFKDLYERELQKGLPTTAALCVVARRIAVVCWSIHKSGTPYDPSRIGPRSARSSSPEPASPSAGIEQAPAPGGSAVQPEERSVA